MQGYPTSFADLPTWSVSNDIAISEARVRFAQFAMLCAIAGVAPLRSGLVFKGGNALDFRWQPNRSTVDLDFSYDMPPGSLQLNVGNVKSLIQRGLELVEGRLGIVAFVHSVRQQPPGEYRTFITYTARVGYALPDQRSLQIRMANGQMSAQVIPVEISINEPVCGSTDFYIREDFQPYESVPWKTL